MVNISGSLEIDKILKYFGFGDLAKLTIMPADSFESYDDILTQGYSDIVNFPRASLTGWLPQGR